jgi:hypothetical protein
VRHRRAAEIEDIRYLGGQLNRSSRRSSFVELVRYGFGWFGLNAIFSRAALLDLIGTPGGVGEYDAFLVLFNTASFRSRHTMETRLRELLTASTAPRLPNTPSGTAVPTLRAIQLKYTPPGQRGRTAKAFRVAAESGNVALLDLPTILYGFRNWFVHGNALDGSFGTRPGFLEYVGILQQALSDVHISTAKRLYATLS